MQNVKISKIIQYKKTDFNYLIVIHKSDVLKVDKVKLIFRINLN